MFGINIFGKPKEKKSSSQLPASPSASRRNGDATSGQGSDGEMTEGFTMVNKDQGHVTYPTILTNDMLRSPTGSAQSTWNSHYQPQPAVTYDAPANGHVRQPSTNPLDNVPFSANMGSAVSRLTSGGQVTELGRYFQVVDRIGQFLSTPSQSDYNFSLERSVVRDQQAASGF
jgi:hypothetical protein